MKTAVIIQARMGSTRLPGKSLMKIEGEPLIWHVVERVKHSKEADVIMVATSNQESDNELAKTFENTNVECYRGNLDDVLERYYQAAKKTGADIMVRITGDSPLVDPFLIDKIVGIFKEGDYDYVSNCKPPWMDGFDVEVFSFRALKDARENAEMTSEREHVTPYMRNNEKFKKYYLENDPRFAEVHCSVDKPNDLEFVRAIYKVFLERGKDHVFTSEDVIELLEEKPEIAVINKGNIINEGYAKSLKENKRIK